MVDEPMPEQPQMFHEQPAVPTAEEKAEAAEKIASGVPEPQPDLKSRKEETLAKLQALFDAKIAEAHAWATKNGGFPAVKLALEELEEVFK